MRRRQVPGPKSKTQSKSFLGESTATEASDAESFAAAELEAHQTDYGFNYTNTNSPRTSKKSHTTKPSAAKDHTQKEANQSKKKKPRKQPNPIQRERQIWKNIRELQNRTDNLTPKAPFGRIIREILMNHSSFATRITVAALEALQLSSEIYLTNLFSDAYVCTLHRGRVTLSVRDVRLVRFIRGPSDSGSK